MDQCSQLDRNILDSVILGQIMAYISKDEVVGPSTKHAPVQRTRYRSFFFHHAVQVCKATFLQLVSIVLYFLILYTDNIILYCPGKHRFQALKAHYLSCGLTTRQHGNTNRLPHNTISFTETKAVVRYLKAYAEDNAILLPGRIPGYKRDDLQLLPSSTTKKV